MSLTVHVFTLGEDGETHILDSPVGTELAGFESWRTTVWGSSVVRSLGARYFPILAGRDLEVPPDEVPDFVAECAVLRADLDAVAPNPDPNRPQDQHKDTVAVVSRRLANIEAAAQRALEIGGGIIIW